MKTSNVKLNKYLFFDVKLEVTRADGFKEKSLVLTPYNYNFIMNNKDVKPILRSFDDLMKDLPLTKSASEMIGMKEGEIILMEYELFDETIAFINENKINYCPEKDLDFLRAMHFAVDFNENEYSKKED